MLGKILGGRIAALAHRHRGGLIAAGRAAEPKIDTLRKQRLQHAELLGDFQRAVIRQQDAAGADAYRRCRGGDARHQYFGTRIRQRLQRVMLREPVAAITEFLRRLRELDRFRHRLRGRMAADDGRLVEDAEFQIGELRLGSAKFEHTKGDRKTH